MFCSWLIFSPIADLGYNFSDPRQLSLDLSVCVRTSRPSFVLVNGCMCTKRPTHTQSNSRETSQAVPKNARNSSRARSSIFALAIAESHCWESRSKKRRRSISQRESHVELQWDESHGRNPHNPSEESVWCEIFRGYRL